MGVSVSSGAQALHGVLASAARGPEEITRVSSISTHLAMHAGDDEGALREVWSAAHRLGHPLPTNTSGARMMAELLRAQWALRRHPPDSFLTMAEAPSLRRRALQHLLSRAGHAGLRASPNRMVISMAHALREAVRHGVTHDTATSLAYYALVLAGAQGRYREAAAYAEAGEALCERSDLAPPRWDAGSHLPTVRCLSAGFVGPWARDLDDCAERLERGFDEGVANGDDMMACCCLVLLSLVFDLKADDVVRDLAHAERAVRENERRALKNWTLASKTNAAAARARLDGFGRSAVRTFETMPQRHPMLRTDCLAAYLWNVLGSDVACSTGRYEEAARRASEAQRLGDQAFGTTGVVFHTLFAGLAHAGCARATRGLQRLTHVASAARARRAFSGWSKLGTPYILGFSRLLDGEIAALSERRAERGRAVARLRDAVVIFEAAGMHRWTGRAEQALARTLTSPVAKDRARARAAAAFERFGSPRMAERLRDGAQAAG